MSALNGIGWFEIGTARPGRLFGWTFTDDSPRGDTQHRIVTTTAASSRPDVELRGVHGGLLGVFTPPPAW